MDPPDPRTDAALVQAANAGDPAAFEALYRRHCHWVARLALRFTGNEADALDVVQETFLYLLRKLPRLRLTARLTTFLYPVVKHLALGIRRKHGRAAGDDAALAEQPVPPQRPAALESEDLATVLGILPEPQREVLLLRAVHEMPLAEIAEALGIPLGTVKSRLHHALATLRADARTRRYFLG